MALITLLCAAFLPEYIAPVFTLSTFLVFKRYFSQTKQKARIGTVGKVFLVYMCYMMISFLWSDYQNFFNPRSTVMDGDVPWRYLSLQPD